MSNDDIEREVKRSKTSTSDIAEQEMAQGSPSERSEDSPTQVEKSGPKTKFTRTRKPLPDILKGITQQDSERLVIGNEILNKEVNGLVVGEVYKVVTGVRHRSNKDDILSFSKLNLQQLRDFSRLMGIPSSSEMNSFECRYSIAIACKRYQVVKGFSTVGGLSGESNINGNQKRYNTVVRLVNVLFSNDFLPLFLTANDCRTRDDYETGVGGQMQRYWKDIAMP